jgi:hypothetical protein
MEIQLVELRFQSPPHLDYAGVKRRAEAILGNELDAPSPKDPYVLFHKNYVAYAGGNVPPQTAILAVDKPIELNAYTEDIQQSWLCPDAGSLLEDSGHTLLVTEWMARMLEPLDRVQLFHGVLQAVVEETRPVVMVFKHSQQVIDPSRYLAATDQGFIHRPGVLNVRFFNISNSEGDMILDTRGLHEIGLHDLQCHFRELEPNEVSRVLFNTAIYILENGPVIESGHTVAGIDEYSKWVCQFEDSLLEPARELLDLNPGAPFAAGGRK